MDRDNNIYPLHINSWGEIVFDSDPYVERPMTENEQYVHERWAGMAMLAKPGMRVHAGINTDHQMWISLLIDFEGEGEAYQNAVREVADLYRGTVEALDDDRTIFCVEFDVTYLDYDSFEYMVNDLESLIQSREALNLIHFPGETAV